MLLKKVYKDWTKEDVDSFFKNNPKSSCLIIPNGDGTNTLIEKEI